MNCAFIQARQTSLRFNKKIFSKIGNYTIIEWIYLRLKKSKKLNNIFFLIPNNKKNKDLKNYLEKKKYNYITGPEHNVLKRFYIGSKIVKPKKIIRICADNPFICWKSVDQLINFFDRNKCHYAYNHIPINNNFPDGIGGEIVDFNTLTKIYKNVKKNKHKEHIFNFIWENEKLFIKKTYNHKNKKLNKPNIKLDIDTKNDLKILRSINPKIYDTSEKILEKYEKKLT